MYHKQYQEPFSLFNMFSHKQKNPCRIPACPDLHGIQLLYSNSFQICNASPSSLAALDCVKYSSQFSIGIPQDGQVLIVV